MCWKNWAEETNMADRDDVMLDYLMEMGTMKPQADKIAQQQAMVQALRQNAAPPQMPQTRGRLQPASNPLEMLGSIANAGAGAYAQQQANTMGDQYSADRMAALGRVRQRQQQPPMGAVPPAGGGSFDNPYAQAFGSPQAGG
jgi:hypothetical protein